MVHAIFEFCDLRLNVFNYFVALSYLTIKNESMCFTKYLFFLKGIELSEIEFDPLRNYIFT